MNPKNERTVLALRGLADRLERSELPLCGAINRHLSLVAGADDVERLLTLLLMNASEARQTLSYAR